MSAGTHKVVPTGNTGLETNPTSADVMRAFEERHYTLQEIAILWNISIDTARRIFAREPGVVFVGGAQRRGKRRYRTLRVPSSVVERVYKKCSLYL